MDCRIAALDYSSDWALKERNVEPRSSAGWLSREEVVEFYGTLGLDGIEFLDHYWHDCSPTELKRLAGNAGLPIVSYIFAADLAQPPAERQGSVDRVLSIIDRTAKLDAPLAMIHPHVVKDGVPLDKQRAWLIDGLRQCAEHAAAVGVTLVAENIDDPVMRPLMGRGADCCDICAAVDSPAFRLIYDVSAPLFVDEDPLETLRVMAPYTVHVHVKNNRRLALGEQRQRYRDSDGGTRYTGTVLDGGIVPLTAILAELDDLGYSGYVSVEYQGEQDPRDAMQYNVDWLRQTLDSHREA